MMNCGFADGLLRDTVSVMQTTQTIDQTLLEQALELEQAVEDTHSLRRAVEAYKDSLPVEELEALTNTARLEAIERYRKEQCDSPFIYSSYRRKALEDLITKQYLTCQKERHGV